MNPNQPLRLTRLKAPPNNFPNSFVVFTATTLIRISCSLTKRTNGSAIKNKFPFGIL